jgi:hypothetical protein
MKALSPLINKLKGNPEKKSDEEKNPLHDKRLIFELPPPGTGAIAQLEAYITAVDKALQIINNIDAQVDNNILAQIRDLKDVSTDEIKENKQRHLDVMRSFNKALNTLEEVSLYFARTQDCKVERFETAYLFRKNHYQENINNTLAKYKEDRELIKEILLKVDPPARVSKHHRA